VELSKLRVDVEKIEQGEWIGDIPGLGDIKLHMRGARNADWIALNRRLLAELPATRFGIEVSREDQDRINVELLVETSLIGWSGLTDNGKPLEFSKDKARQLLSDPELRDFRDAVWMAANTVGMRAHEAARQEAKN
jgi:hypothetical protein